MYLQNRDSQTKRTNLEKGTWKGKGWKEGIVRQFEMDMYTLLYLKWVTNRDLLYSTWNSALCYVTVWMGVGFEGEWIHIYVWLNFFVETTTTLLIGYTSV